MRLLVVGATGALGRDVVRSALAAGHDVSALVRRPEQAGLPEVVRAVKGDVLNEATLDPALVGHDAVVCALGTLSPRLAARGSGGGSASSCAPRWPTSL